MTTSGATSGDHSAGFSLGSAVGKVGKAEAPPPGQTLLFCVFDPRVRSHTCYSFSIILAVIGIALQELLREVRIVMMSILICGRW